MNEIHVKTVEYKLIGIRFLLGFSKLSNYLVN